MTLFPWSVWFRQVQSLVSPSSVCVGRKVHRSVAPFSEKTCPCKNSIWKVTLATEFLQAYIHKAVTHRFAITTWKQGTRNTGRCHSQLPTSCSQVFLRFVKKKQTMGTPNMNDQSKLQGVHSLDSTSSPHPQRTKAYITTKKDIKTLVLALYFGYGAVGGTARSNKIHFL